MASKRARVEEMYYEDITSDEEEENTLRLMVGGDLGKVQLVSALLKRDTATADHTVLQDLKDLKPSYFLYILDGNKEFNTAKVNQDLTLITHTVDKGKLDILYCTDNTEQYGPSTTALAKLCKNWSLMITTVFLYEEESVKCMIEFVKNRYVNAKEVDVSFEEMLS